MSGPAWSEIGDRVFVRRYRTWNAEPFDQNVGAVLGADGVVIIDTRASHRLADELLADLRDLTHAVIAAVVNTHHHWDHTWGNARFAGPIWGHTRCAERVLADSEAARRRIVEEEPSLAAELAEVTFVAPDRTLEDRVALDIGDRQLELRHLGRGHTDNDVVVLVPDATVVFAGDLLENDAAPSFGDAFPIAWAGTALQLAALVEGAVVPGHGGVGDAGFAQRQAADLATLAELGRQASSGTLDRDEAIRRSPFPAGPTATALDRVAVELRGG